jgi:hypothetical protein
MTTLPDTDDRTRFSSERCTITVERPAAGVVLVRISGYDRGQFGLQPLDEVAADMQRWGSVHLFVDAADASGATWSVSEQWTDWFAANRARLAGVAILVASPLVRQTIAVARELSRTGRLIDIYDDRGRFEDALSRATAPRVA